MSRISLLLILFISTFQTINSAYATDEIHIQIDEKEESLSASKPAPVKFSPEEIEFLSNPHASYDLPIAPEEIEEAKTWMLKSEKYRFLNPLNQQEMLGVKAEVIGEGNCFFTATLLTRASAIKNVIDQADNLLLRALMAEKYITNKKRFIDAFKTMQHESSYYLMYAANLRRGDDGNVDDELVNAAQDDEVSPVMFANSMDLVVLTYAYEDVTKRLLYPTALFRNPKPTQIKTAFIIFEGEGEFGNKGIHYNMIVPADRPDSLTEEEYNTLIVQARRRQIAADLWDKLTSISKEHAILALRLQFPKEYAQELANSSSAKKKDSASEKKKDSAPEKKKDSAPETKVATKESTHE